MTSPRYHPATTHYHPPSPNQHTHVCADDEEFRTFLDHLGRVTRPEELRLRIYHGGVDPSLRKVVWRILLNVFPVELTGEERLAYLKRKSGSLLLLWFVVAVVVVVRCYTFKSWNI